MIEPKVQDRPKIVLDLEEPEINIGPRKLFSDWEKGLGQQAQKEFWAQGILNAADRARITRCTSLEINAIHEAQSVI